MLKQQLNIKLQQKLNPQQIQVVKMLEYPAIELEDRINQELIDNPALELGKEDNTSENEDSSSNVDQDKQEIEDWMWGEEVDETDHYEPRTYRSSNEDNTYVREQGFTEGFIDNLKQQLQTSNLPKELYTIAEYIIGSLDSDGYLRRNNTQILDELLINYGISTNEEDIEECISKIQTLEPAGIGARDLRECLLIQLRGLSESAKTELAVDVIDKYFDLFVKKQYDVIAKKTNSQSNDIRNIQEIIKHLNPKPGNAFSNSSDTLVRTIAPDFTVQLIDGELVTELITSNIPELRISAQYNDMVQEFIGNKENQTRDKKEALQFAHQKIEAARWFIDSIKQRNNTLLTTMNAIVDMQQDYFIFGDDTKLRPMRLKDIADKTGYDISTISRVSNSKYVETDWGIISLKYFFSEAMEHNSGEKVSNKEIKLIIRETINGEDKNYPITDEDITKLLNEKGYIIARRTVAKYRENMDIPVARERKN